MLKIAYLEKSTNPPTKQSACFSYLFAIVDSSKSFAWKQ